LGFLAGAGEGVFEGKDALDEGGGCGGGAAVGAEGAEVLLHAFEIGFDALDFGGGGFLLAREVVGRRQGGGGGGEGRALGGGEEVGGGEGFEAIEGELFDARGALEGFLDGDGAFVAAL